MSSADAFFQALCALDARLQDGLNISIDIGADGRVSIGPSGGPAIHASRHAQLEDARLWAQIRAAIAPQAQSWADTCPWLLAGAQAYPASDIFANMHVLLGLDAPIMASVTPRRWAPNTAPSPLSSPFWMGAHNIGLLVFLRLLPTFTGPFVPYRAYKASTAKTPLHLMAGSDTDAVHLARAMNAPKRFWEKKTGKTALIITRHISQDAIDKAHQETGTRIPAVHPDEAAALLA